MVNILFYLFPEFKMLEARIKENYQLLRQRLRNRNRKLVLLNMDDKDLICSDVSLVSFICGFWLAWQIANQIQNYDGCSDCIQKAESDTRQLFYKEVDK